MKSTALFATAVFFSTLAPVITRAEAPATNRAVQPAERMKEQWWKDRWSQKTGSIKAAAPEVVFLGDSITQGWEGAGKEIWKSKIEPLKPFNVGYSGDRTEHVLWRIDNGELDGISPKLIVILIGTNNIGHGSSNPEQTIEGTKQILARLEKKLPNTKVLLQAVFPRSDKPLQPSVDAINKGYATLADNKRVFFIDFTKNFLNPDGTLGREIMPDLLHLSPKGYQIWWDAISGKVTELMK